MLFCVISFLNFFLFCECFVLSYLLSSLFLTFKLFLKDGTTPLFIACEKGHIEVTQILLGGEANVDFPIDVSRRIDLCVILCGFF